VILNLYQGDEVIKAKANINAEDYIKADKAHMNSGSYIKLKGILHPGSQIRLIDNISSFDLISP